MTDTEYKDTLLKYLAQYINAVRRRRSLERRLRAICREMDMPIGGIHYSPVNSSSGGISSGSAAFTLRKSEIESRIAEQKRQAEADILSVMDILDYLDPNSEGRQILEYKYIDGYSWIAISKKMYLSRPQCFRKRDKALANLLEYKRVQKILEDYAAQKQVPVV